MGGMTWRPPDQKGRHDRTDSISSPMGWSRFSQSGAVPQPLSWLVSLTTMQARRHPGAWKSFTLTGRSRRSGCA